MGKATTIERSRPEARVEAEAVGAQAPECQHHWLIESPHGTMSQGRCKRCGAEREFRNSATDYLWEDESSSGYNAWRGVRARKQAADEEEVAVSAPAREPAMMV